MEIEVVSPIEAEAEVQKYLLVSDDIYMRRYDASTVPDWYKQMIADMLTTDPTITDIRSAIDFLTSQGVGFNQSIYELNTADLSINSSLTTLVSQVGQNTAGVGELWATKVDSTSATAIAQSVVASEFTTPTSYANAWFSDKVSTYASATSANTTSIQTLSSTLDGLTVSLTSLDSTVATLDGWASSATKLITAPDGSITGWRFADGSNVESTFDIYATNFKITDGATGYTPFSISSGNINFNGKVQFSNVLNTPTINKTWIQTSKPTTGMVAGDTWIDTTNGNNKTYTYNGSSWVATAAKTFVNTTAPTSGMTTGDNFYNTTTGKMYVYNGSSWILPTVDAGNKTFYLPSTTTPTGYKEGDIWYKTDLGYKMYRYSNASGWQAVYETTIDGGRITTGVINADLITAGTLKVGYLEAEKLDVTYLKKGHGINIIGGGTSSALYWGVTNGTVVDVIPSGTTFTIPTNVIAGSVMKFTFTTNLVVNNGTNSIATIRLDINGVSYYPSVYLQGTSGIYETVTITKRFIVNPGQVIPISLDWVPSNNATNVFLYGYDWVAEINNKGSTI